MCTQKVPVHSEVGEVVARGTWRNLGEWGPPKASRVPSETVFPKFATTVWEQAEASPSSSSCSGNGNFARSSNLHTIKNGFIHFMHLLLSRD